MARKRRNVSDAVPRYPVVSPEGLIKMVAVAINLSGALEMDEDDQPVLSRYHERQGWVLLQSLYEQIGRPDLWEAWQLHRTATDKARGRGQSIPPFPNEYLPPEVLRRRAGHRPNVVTWTMPKLAPIVADDASDAAPAKGKRSA